MKILIDTNVILDIALERNPFVEHAALLFKIANKKRIHIFMTATTVTDLYYIIRKEKGKDIALSFIEDLIQFVDVASVDKNVVINALRSEISDFEDAIQSFSAKQEGITIIITRNEKDFINSGLEILTPETFLDTLNDGCKR
ncbi:twitching motility protein PilT [Candidatus Magnetomorum sp. HK-1]|nr:twitching motility protein PilT [Candidatus Magnetomorum sp. HK-1]